MYTPIAFAFAILTPAQASADPIQLWNEAALQSIRAEKTPPPIAARQLAILHIAMFDAANAVNRGYTSFEVETKVTADATEAVAASHHRDSAWVSPGSTAQPGASIQKAGI